MLSIAKNKVYLLDSSVLIALATPEHSFSLKGFQIQAFPCMTPMPVSIPTPLQPQALFRIHF